MSFELNVILLTHNSTLKTHNSLSCPLPSFIREGEISDSRTLPAQVVLLQRVNTEQHSLSQRYILTLVGQQKLAFASDWVLEIITFQRSQVLSLPFYNPMMLGVVYYRAKLVPLIETSSILKLMPSEDKKETLTAMRLSHLTGELAGVGLLVDRAVGSISREQLVNYTQKPPIRVFQPEDFPSTIWQPQR